MSQHQLGILGLGSRSTIFYIEELNRLYHEKHGGYSTCPLKMLNINFNTINNLLPNSSKELEHLVNDALIELLSLDVDTVLIPNITLFETIDKLSFNAEIVHPVRSTLNEIQKTGHKKAILFGSSYTMQSEYIKKFFATHGIELISPSKQEIALIDGLRKEVYHKSESKEMVDNYNELIKIYSEKYAVLIACTELSIVASTENINIFDLARIQIATAFSRI